MTYEISKQWNPRQAKLKDLLKKEETFGDAIKLCGQLHSEVHLPEVYSSADITLCAMVYEGLKPVDYALMPTRRDVTIAWNLWHITRIEDITMNLLVAKGNQVLDKTWLKKLNTQVTDTGNAMIDEEIIALSEELNQEELWRYRCAVGLRSKEIIESLTFEDLKRKFTPKQVERITDEGCLTTHTDSIWLKDFWGRKTVSGILTLPLTRHQAGHLNDCLKLKTKINRINKNI